MIFLLKIYYMCILLCMSFYIIFYQHRFVSIITINDNVYIFYTTSLGTYVHSTTLLFVFMIIFEGVKLQTSIIILFYNLYDTSK